MDRLALFRQFTASAAAICSLRRCVKHCPLPQAALVSGLFALAVELLRFLIPPGESQAFLAAAAGEPQRPAEPGNAAPADLPSQGVRGTC